MTRVKSDDVRAAFGPLVQEKVQEAAGNNRVLSKDEQKKLEPFLEEAAAHVRADAGKGARIDVDQVTARAVEDAGAIWAKHNPPGGRGGDGKFLSRAELRAIARENASLGALTQLAVLRATQGDGDAGLGDAVTAFFTNFDYRADPNTGRRPLHAALPGGRIIDARLDHPRERANVPAGALAGYDVYRPLMDHDVGTVTLQKAKIDGHDVYLAYASTDGDDAYLEVYDKRGTPVTSGRIFGEQLVGLDEVFGRCRFSANVVALDGAAQTVGAADPAARAAQGQLPLDWQPELVLSQGRLERGAYGRLGHLDVPALEGSPRLELAAAAFEYLFDTKMRLRVGQGDFLLGAQREGTLELGTWTRPADGKELEIARWRDAGDASATLYFDRTAEGRLKLAVSESNA